MVTRIDLRENGDPLPAQLDTATAALLAEVKLVEVRPNGVGGGLLVPRTNRVGAARIGSIDVVVKPKAPFSSLLFMLGYAHNTGLRPDMFDGSSQDDLWPMVAETLARLAERALLHGVIQGYVTRDDSLALVRGRIRTAEQMSRRYALPLPLEVTYDEYDVDIAENQILRTALERMRHVPRLPFSLRSRLQHLSGRLGGARAITQGAPIPVWRPTRLNTMYQPALQIAELVLRQLGLATAAASQPVASFGVDMDKVFESFVTVALQESLLRISPGVTTGQFQDHLDTGSQVPIRPDIVHSITGVPTAVLDAKYKLGTDKDGYPTSDVYQMLAYCTALQVNTGYLVYAGSKSKGAAPRTRAIRHTEVAVVMWPLDVGVEPRELLDQVAAVGATAVGAKRPVSLHSANIVQNDHSH